MLVNYLDSTKKRTILTCNYNYHVRDSHPDRILDYHDLLYIIKGTWCIGQDGISYDLIPGDIMLLQGNHHHYGPKPCPDYVQTLYICFTTYSSDGICNNIDFHPDQYKFPMSMNANDHPILDQHLRKIIHTYWSQDPYAPNMASAYLDFLLCEMSSICSAKNSLSPLIQDVQNTIFNTPDRFFKIQELADKYHISLRTLTSRFKKETGYSLHEWQLMQKCEMAQDLLNHNSSLTLKELALSFGFYDEFHFSKCFKKHFGYSPRKRINQPQNHI